MVEICCIPLIIAVLALAFPILLQTTSRIDDKYRSTRLIRAFYREKVYIIFIASLICSLSSIIIWFANFPRLVNWGKGVNYLIENSSFILILGNSVFLVIILFQFVRLIKIYFDPLRLSEHLENKYDQEEE